MDQSTTCSTISLSALLGSRSEPAWRSPLEKQAGGVLGRLGVSYEYEAESFTLSNGERYVPDFWCPKIGTFIEVKGDQAPARLHKPALLGEQLDPDDYWHNWRHADDDWFYTASDYKVVLNENDEVSYGVNRGRARIQVFVWTQKQLYHAGWHERECHSYWVVCSRCVGVQPHCTRAPHVCRRCEGTTATLSRLGLDHWGITSARWDWRWSW